MKVFILIFFRFISSQKVGIYNIVVCDNRWNTVRWGRLYPSSRLCGNTLPMTMKTLQQHLTIILVSHTTRLNHSGFKLQYNIQKEGNNWRWFKYEHNEFFFQRTFGQYLTVIRNGEEFQEGLLVLDGLNHSFPIRHVNG